VDNVLQKIIIDLKAIRENYLAVSRIAGKNVVTSAVVKSDGYGLGAKKISQILYETGCRHFWTACIREAVSVRAVLPSDTEIYYLQGANILDIDCINNYRIVPVINSIQSFNDLKEKGIDMVLHIDTGMTRLGIRSSDVDVIAPFLKRENIKYVISHLACSKNKKKSASQKEIFDKALHSIRNVIDVKASISASNGISLGNEYLYDMVRIGGFLYGVNISDLNSKNVVTLITYVLQRYDVDAGTSIGYDWTFTTKSKITIAIVAAGYGDGIKRSLSNKGHVIFYDENMMQYKARILGNISMDSIVCDVTNIPKRLTEYRSVAVILDEKYSINEMGIDAGTDPCELLISMRIAENRFKKEYES
jgi:alanine racemase